MDRPRLVLVALVTVWLAACGSSPTAPGQASATITIGPGGVTPKDVRIKGWGFVTFVNADTRPHTILSDPLDLHTQCPPINRVGVLQPGERRDTGTLTVPGACGFHDHDDRVDAFRGRIVVE